MSAQIEPKNINVALICGGSSGEREVSLASGQGSKEALESAGFQVTMIDPSVKEDLVTLINGNFDVAFLTLHGKGGEDGTIQGMLEILGIPYTGSGVWSSSLAIDKAKSKVFYRHFGITTPRSKYLTDPKQMTGEEVAELVGNHCVVKAATEGSALGVYIVEGPAAIEEAMEKVFEIDTACLVETFIDGLEFTVAVLGNEDPKALPVIQIVPQAGDFYDYESKYAPGGSKHLCPAPISEELTLRAQALAEAAHRALGCRGVSRTDMILNENDGKFYVLETNTIPGMTATSLLPDAGRAAGIEFPELCTKLIELALA